jgi:2-methylcitrate dehydratase PrpD
MQIQPELELSEFIAQYRPGEVPEKPTQVARRVLLAVAGTGVAAAGEEGIAELYTLLQRRGGAAQARAIAFGGSLPAHAAAQFNGTLCRALDFCDARSSRAPAQARICSAPLSSAAKSVPACA